MFKVGDEVVSESEGKGIVSSVTCTDHGGYPIRVSYKHFYFSYTKEGIRNLAFNDNNKRNIRHLTKIEKALK